jgi:hypothetical protein
LRRLDGVDHVVLDTVDQFAIIYFGDPAPIDFAEVLDAADSAAFAVKSMTLRSQGTVQHSQCERCASDHALLLLSGTDQPLSLADGETAQDGPQSFEAIILGWDTNEPRLDLVEAPAPGN